MHDVRAALFFHPDYHRRLWSVTRSADLSKTERSRAYYFIVNHRRWGLSPRPEVTLILQEMLILSKNCKKEQEKLVQEEKQHTKDK